MPNAFPVVFVHGLLGFGPRELAPLRYRGTAFKVHSPLPRFEAIVGPLGSAHDRARELAVERGGWQYEWKRDVDHLDLRACPEPGQIGRQRRPCIDLIDRLAELPEWAVGAEAAAAASASPVNRMDWSARALPRGVAAG